MLFQLFFWFIVVYLVFVRKKMLECPHCGKKGISAVKKFFLGPLFSSRCAICNKKWGTSNGAVWLAFLTIPAAGISILMGMFKSGTFYFAPLILTFDVVVRLYFLPTVKK